MIFVAVADEQAFVTLMHRERDHQFGFGTGFKPVVKLFARIDDLIDDFA